MEETKTSRQKLPWNPWLALTFAVVIYFVAPVLAGLLLIIYPRLEHWPSAQTKDWLNNSIWAQFSFIILSYGFILLALKAFIGHYARGFKSIGLRKPRWSDFGYGLLAVPAYYGLALLSLGIARALVPSLNFSTKQEVGFQSAHGGLELAAAFIGLVLIAPVVEEIIVRGFLYGSLREHMSKIVAAIITSIIFAAAHLGEGSGGLLWTAAIQFFSLSLVLVYLREKTKGLAAPITLHMFNNFVAFGSLFLWHIR